ncbi:hypothetical protein BDQ17DRAFT_1322168 [Cyathus striatus]|nr:hypothetical protein BDQ17DRAFT_1322168 [Cyathus striatus]
MPPQPDRGLSVRNWNEHINPPIQPIAGINTPFNLQGLVASILILEAFPWYQLEGFDPMRSSRVAEWKEINSYLNCMKTLIRVTAVQAHGQRGSEKRSQMHIRGSEGERVIRRAVICNRASRAAALTLKREAWMKASTIRRGIGSLPDIHNLASVLERQGNMENRQWDTSFREREKEKGVNNKTGRQMMVVEDLERAREISTSHLEPLQEKEIQRRGRPTVLLDVHFTQRWYF